MNLNKMTIQKCFEQLIGYVADQREALEKGRAIDDTDLYNIDVLLVRLQDQCNTTDINESVDPINDFALRISKALKESQSSTALFFVQQAYPDDIDGLDQPNSNEILDNIITIATERAKNINQN